MGQQRDRVGVANTAIATKSKEMQQQKIGRKEMGRQRVRKCKTKSANGWEKMRSMNRSQLVVKLKWQEKSCNNYLD